MEITNSPPPALPPIQSTSTVEDGDVGQKGSFYSRNKKNQQQNLGQPSEEPSLQIDPSTRLIDILV